MMNVVRQAFAVFFATMALMPPALATDDRLASLDAYISSGLSNWELPGLAVAVVEQDKLVYARGFGIKELGRPGMIDEHTLFQIGSTSKAIAAASVGALVDRGELGWDTPLIEYLPWFKMPDPWVASHVTLRDMLLHRSGLQDTYFPILRPLNARQVAEIIPELANTLPFRQQHAYCNLGYGITGLAVEAVSGMSWAQFVETQLFRPMGMTNSGGTPYNYWAEEQVAPVFLGTAPAGPVSYIQSKHPNVAMPHGLDRNFQRRVLPWLSYDNMAAAGSVVSSVYDMSRWLRMLLNEGELQGHQILTPSTVREILSPQIPAPAYNPFTDEDGYDFYAMGWHREKLRGYQLLSHGGGIFGFPAYMAIVPEAEIGVVVLANGSTWTPYYPHKEITARVIELLQDLEPKDLRAIYLKQHEAIRAKVSSHYQNLNNSRNPDDKSDWSLADLAGKYEDKFAGTLNIRYQGGMLTAAIEGTGAFSGTLEHWQGNTFRLWYDGGDGGAFAGAQVSFVGNKKGGIERLDGTFLGQFYRRSN